MIFHAIVVYILSLYSTYDLMPQKVSDSFKNGYLVTLSILPRLNEERDYNNLFRTINYLSMFNYDISDVTQLNKISIKTRQLGKTLEEKQINLLRLLRHANNKNVFVWISATLSKNLNEEIYLYKYAKENGFTKIGITLATYNANVVENVKDILNMKGHIRLVKGYYKGALSNNWNKVTTLMRECLELLIESGYYHCVGTHDFDVIRELYIKYTNTQLKNIEFSFFYSSRKYVYYNVKRYNINFKIKSFFIPFGYVLSYFINTLPNLDIKRIISRQINSLSY